MVIGPLALLGYVGQPCLLHSVRSSAPNLMVGTVTLRKNVAPAMATSASEEAAKQAWLERTRQSTYAVPSWKAVTPVKDKPRVSELSSLDEFNTRVRNHPASAIQVVKLYKNNCRACRALKPKFEAMAEEMEGAADFFEVNVANARPIFEQEGIWLTPSILVYCSGVGRINGLGGGGGKQLVAEVKSDLRLLLRDAPEKLDALRAVTPAALEPLLRFAALVDVLRAVKQVERLLSASSLEQTRSCAAGLSHVRREEVRSLFEWLDQGSSGVVGVDELVAATQALCAGSGGGSGGGSAAPMLSGCFAPTRLAASGLAFEQASLEGAVRAVCEFMTGPADDQAAECAVELNDVQNCDRFLSVEDLSAVVALYDDSELRAGRPKTRLSAIFAVLDEDGGGVLSNVAAAAAIEATFRALPDPSLPVETSERGALEAVLHAFDLQASGELNSARLARLIARGSKLQ